MPIEEDLQEPLLERLSATPELNNSSLEAQKSSKRKREADLPESKKAAKKPKNKKKKAGDENDNELDTEAGINNAFSHMDSNLLADYIAQRTRKYESELSSIELEDRYLPGM
jgi:protein CMS1